MRRGAGGFALILVIWALVLLTSLATGFALAIRHEIRVAGDMASIAQAEATAADGQFPKATILSCVDSRVPVEIIWFVIIALLEGGLLFFNFDDLATRTFLVLLFLLFGLLPFFLQAG